MHCLLTAIQLLVQVESAVCWSISRLVAEPPPPPPRTRAAELERDRRNGERVPGEVLARPTMVKRSGGDAGVMPGDGAGA